MIDEKKLYDDVKENCYPMIQKNNSIENGMTLNGIKQCIDEQSKIGEWVPCSEPPKHPNEVLIFNGKSYSVGYYDGKTWVNTIHPVEWQEINHEPKQSDQKFYQ